MPTKRTVKFRAFEFDHPLKPSLERWILLDSRLAEVEKSLALLLGHYTAASWRGKFINMSDGGQELMRPLYCFAVVTYVRCFGGGRRQPLRISDVPRLSTRDLHIHEDVRTLRNHHFAHAVADEEGAHLLAVPQQSRIGPGFALYNVVLAGPGLSRLRAFLSLVRKVRRYVKTKEEQAGNQIAMSIFGPKATWRACLANGAEIMKGDAGMAFDQTPKKASGNP